MSVNWYVLIRNFYGGLKTCYISSVCWQDPELYESLPRYYSYVYRITVNLK